MYPRLDEPAPGPRTCEDWHKLARWEARKRDNGEWWWWCTTCQRWVKRHPFDLDAAPGKVYK